MSDAAERDLGIIEIPVFPLPNVVLFPHTLLPLHIFEPRYRRLVRDALRSERRIAMALYKNGEENPEAGGNDCYDIGGMGDITKIEELKGGRYNILVAGRSRYRFVDMVARVPYRVARVQLLDDVQPEPKESLLLCARLLRLVSRLRLRPEGKQRLEELGAMPFPQLLNSICSEASVDEHSKQILLQMNSLKSRAEAIIQVLDRQLSQEAFIEKFAHLRPEDSRVN